MLTTTNNPNSKVINCLLAGQGRGVQVEVMRDTRIGQMLQKMGMNPSDCDVAAPDGSRLLGLDEKPFEICQDPHDSIVVSPSAQVG